MKNSNMAILFIALTIVIDEASQWIYNTPMFDQETLMFYWIFFCLLAIMFILEEQNDEEDDSG